MTPPFLSDIIFLFRPIWNLELFIFLSILLSFNSKFLVNKFLVIDFKLLFFCIFASSSFEVILFLGLIFNNFLSILLSVKFTLLLIFFLSFLALYNKDGDLE